MSTQNAENLQHLQNELSEDQFTHYMEDLLSRDKYFIQLDDIVKQPISREEDNKPIVIYGEKGVGKKSFLVKWMEFHQRSNKKKEPDIIISHLASAGMSNSNYFYSIYKILSFLREILNISQKVDLVDEKLRKYFSYWLEICSRRLSNQSVSESIIIIIIEGLEKFRDQVTGNITSVAAWIPRSLPSRVKLILSINKQSEYFEFFSSRNFFMIELKGDHDFTMKLLARYLSKSEIYLEEEKYSLVLQIIKEKYQAITRNPLFCLRLLSFIVPRKPLRNYHIHFEEKFDPREFALDVFLKIDIDKLKEISNIDHLYEFILLFYKDKLIHQPYFVKLALVLSISLKGLTKDEVLTLTGCTQHDFAIFIMYFNPIIIYYRNYYIFKDDFMKDKIKQIYLPLLNQNINDLHDEIALELDRTAHSIRKLEETSFQLFMSKSYFRLKESVSNIENFLLLFNPNTKYDLYQYWQRLEEKGFDPAYEYNKAIEGFDMHYHPDPKNVFKIIIQISRFLKEFSDFENSTTPECRHPPISGNNDLEEIGLAKEIQILEMYFQNDTLQKPVILNKIESLNVDTPFNRDQMRNHFLKMVNEMKEEHDRRREDDEEGLEIDDEEKLRKRNSIYDGEL